MPMNQKIREKKKKLGLTQEQVAEYLGVSTPAVSKWESGVSCPDITLLPALARVLKTDPNALLCFHEEPSEQEIQQFCTAITKILEKSKEEDGLKEALDLMEQKIREYPYCMSMLHMFALILDGALILSTLTSDEKKFYEDRILSWHRRVVESSDEKLKVSSAFLLASRYMMREEYDKAQEMIDLLPEYNMMDKKVIQAELYMRKKEQLPDARKLLQRKLFSSVMDLQGILMRLVKTELADHHTEKAAQIAEIAGQAVKLLGYGDYYSYISLLDVALDRKDEAESLRLLDALLSSSFHLWKDNDCPLYDQIADTFAGERAAAILPPLLANLDQSPEYEFLRPNKEFQALMEKYRKKCFFNK